MVDNQDVLMHYGILGMKWGVRRTPEQLGHKKAAVGANRLQKYKNQKIAKVEKMYAKSMGQVKTALEYDPNNKDLKKQLKHLESLRKKDIDKVESMSYTDVVNEKARVSSERRAKAAQITKSVIKTAGATALWGARMGLVGVKIYGVFKAGTIIAEFAGRGVEWLGSEEGQAFLGKGFNAINTFVNVADKAASVANPDLGKYLDTEKLADMAIAEGQKYVEQSINDMITRL